MRFFKATLRTLIMMVSTFSFLGGWILLAHSLKPAQTNARSSTSVNLPAVVVTPLPTLAPLPGMGLQQQTQSSQQTVNPLTIIAQPQVQQQAPVFVTSGS
jgi:hypothetical protein